MEERRLLAILTVNSLADSHINMDGVLTLREAIEVVQQGNTNGLDATTIANQISGSLASNNTITFAQNLDGGTVTLDLAFGQMSFSKSLTIDAGGLSSGITINGNDPTPAHTGQGIRIFNITDPTSGAAPPLVTIVGMTLKGGDVGGLLGRGGAIRSEARLVLRDCTFTDNEADLGGAIYVRVASGKSMLVSGSISNGIGPRPVEDGPQTLALVRLNVWPSSRASVTDVCHLRAA